MKSGYAILRKGQILIQGYSKTVHGGSIAYGEVYVADENTEPEELGHKVLSALNNSIQGVPFPADQKEWNAVTAPMLKAAGVKSWSTLAKGAKAVGIELENGTVTIEPSANYEKEGGEGLPEKSIYCTLDPNELGNALLQAFAACE